MRTRNPAQHNTKDFWEKKVPKTPDFKEIILTSSYLDKWVLGGRQNTAGNFKKKLSSLGCSQIWLIPLVDDC
jgi:hypothetical protein